MARAASAVLTPNDKKLVVADLTATVKTAGTNIAALRKLVTNAEKAIATADKEAAKKVAAVNKELAATVKALSKDIGTTNKEIVVAEKKLAGDKARLELIKTANVPAAKPATTATARPVAGKVPAAQPAAA
jgi:hypothetical protein